MSSRDLMESEKPQRLRLPEEAVDAHLDYLDSTDGKSPAADSRQSERLRYRLRALHVELMPSSGRPARYLVPTRNLSRDGLAFLIGHYVYAGTPCKLHLISVSQHKQVITGKVMRCRYLNGSGTLHEVGVLFDRPIDAANFTPEARSISILLVDDDPSIPDLVVRLLKSVNAEITHADSGERTLAAVADTTFDVVLLDMQLGDMDGFDVVKKMRANGYRGQVVAMTALTSDEDRKRCIDAGCDRHLAKPLRRDALRDAVTQSTVPALISEYADDADLAGLIDQFVQSLPQRVNELETALAEQDMASFARSVLLLKGQGGSYGFDVITKTATQLDEALRKGEDVASLQAQLSELCKWCRAARLVGGSDEAG